MTWEQVTGFVGSVGGILIAVLAWRRSVKVDAISAQSGAAEGARAGTAQIIEALNSLVDQLQEGAVTARDDIRWLTTRLENCVNENLSIKQELADLRRKYNEH